MTKDKALRMALEALETLWDILDDIDTAADMAKENDAWYRKRVEALQKKRWDTMITTDGYKLKGGPVTAIKEALAQPEQVTWHEVTWRAAAIRVGEDLCSVGPFGYYDMTAEQWLDWALSVVTVHAPPQPEHFAVQEEPVAWMHTNAAGHSYFRKKPQDSVFRPTPLYAEPSRRRHDRAVELLERCENEMRYAGWKKFESDNPQRNGLYEQIKEFLK